MFLYCPIKDKECAFCGKTKDELRCGIAKNNNYISNMNKCPYKPRKRR